MIASKNASGYRTFESNEKVWDVVKSTESLLS